MTVIDPRQKVLKHFPHLASFAAGKRLAPVNVEIDLCNRCDLKCAGCHFAYTHTRGPWAGKVEKPAHYISGGDVMPLDLAGSMLEQLARAGVKSVTWTGGGEPTLHPHFDAIVTLAADLGLEQGIYTHGGHINSERAALLRRRFAWVYISLDAHDRESYREYKGVDRWDKVMDNIQHLVYATGPATIGVGCLLHEHNYHTVDKVVAALRDTGVDYVQFRPQVLYRQDAPGVRDEAGKWARTDVVPFLHAYQHDPFVIADLARFRDYGRWEGHGYPTCYWAAMQTVVTPNGKVWRCVNKREHAEALLGDLAVESFADIWARAGGPCAVDSQCRVMCRGHIANQSLTDVLAPTPHANFI